MQSYTANDFNHTLTERHVQVYCVAAETTDVPDAIDKLIYNKIIAVQFTLASLFVAQV